jgi:hypothetical protein
MDVRTRDWLLDADPSIRWQAVRDLGLGSEDEWAAERRRVATEGWGSRLLDLQGEDGNWGGGVYSPKWVSTTYTMLLLRHLGIDPKDDRMHAATSLVDEKVTMSGPFFQYSTETCITGMVLALGSYFLDDASAMPQTEKLFRRQRRDGGWNCQVGSDRSSFHTTISVLEGLLEFERAIGGDPAAEAARERAHEYLLERRLMYSLRSGELVNSRWLLMSFPPRWHYDVLRGLDYLRDAGAEPDPRCDEAVEMIRSKRRANGTWPLQGRHAGEVHFEMENPGEPSRWNTLRVLRVLAWYDS